MVPECDSGLETIRAAECRQGLDRSLARYSTVYRSSFAVYQTTKGQGRGFVAANQFSVQVSQSMAATRKRRPTESALLSDGSTGRQKYGDSCLKCGGSAKPTWARYRETRDTHVTCNPLPERAEGRPLLSTDRPLCKLAFSAQLLPCSVMLKPWSDFAHQLLIYMRARRHERVTIQQGSAFCLSMNQSSPHSRRDGARNVHVLVFNSN